MVKAQSSDDRNRRLALNRASIVASTAKASIGERSLKLLILPSVTVNLGYELHNTT